MELLKSLILLLAGVGVFIVGMNMMGDGLEKGAGKGLKKLLAKISNNRIAGVGIGTAVTGIIQSSSATSVMVIGLVNAGVMTLFQATAIIMGANIGTTVTGLIVALSGSKGAISFSDIAILLAFIGVMMMFVKKEKVKLIGSILCGLGIIFVGLGIMGDALDPDKFPQLTSTFASVFTAIDFPLILIVLGAVFTAIIQSSSAATGIVITLVGATTALGEPVLAVSSALFIVLGSNIGTCVTAVIACLGAGTNAKRAAFIHLLFNIIGTIVFTALIWPLQDKVVWLLEKIPNSQMQLAWFHVIFNITTTAVLLPFIKQLVWLAEKAIPEKKKTEEERHLKFVDERLLKTPSVALMQVKREVGYMATLAQENIERSFAALQKDGEKTFVAIEETESIIDFTNHALTKYLVKLSPLVDRKDEKEIGAYFHVLNDLERIGDHAENFGEIAVQMQERGLEFSDGAKAELKNMEDCVLKMFKIAIEAISSGNPAHLGELTALENQTDELKRELSSQHYVRLAEGGCKLELSPYFTSMVTGLERVADHLVNVGYSILNPTGSQSEAKKDAAKA